MNDLNILHGTVVRPEGCFAGGVEVKDGTIVRVLLEGVLYPTAPAWASRGISSRLSAPAPP